MHMLDHDFPVLIAPNLGCPTFLPASPDTTRVTLDLTIIHTRKESTKTLSLALEDQLVILPLIREFEDSRARRGPAIPVTVEEIHVLPKFAQDDPKAHEIPGYNWPWEGILKKERAFGARDQFARVMASFTLPEELRSQIATDGHVLCDLVQTFVDNTTRVNAHAVDLTNQAWRDYTFYHATDLHISKRNDMILTVIKQRMKKSVSRVTSFFNRLAHRETAPVEERFINLNNNLRLFINRCNADARAGRLDFVVLTGDLLDYCIPSDGGKSVVDFKYENTNWVKFKNLLLGLDHATGEGVQQGREILVPVFTTVGNHDYRAYHYSIKWGKLYKLVGLKRIEAFHFSDPVPATPPTALVQGPMCLQGYWREFSPYQDFVMRLGDALFFVMDSGADSFAAFRDLLSGSPALTGFTDEQMGWLNCRVDSLARFPKQTFILFHAPAINPSPLIKFVEKIKAFFKKTKQITLKGLRERKLREEGLDDPRVDFFIKLKHGTITNNWDKFLEFALRTRAFVVNGHTHQVKEFRGEPTTEKTFDFTAIPFVPKKIYSPLALYHDKYSKIAPDPAWIDEHRPFFLQTSALGPNSYHEDRNYGGFRQFAIVDGKVESFAVNYVRKAGDDIADAFE